MEARQMKSRRMPGLLLTCIAGAAPAAAGTLSDVPFWSANAGWWESENTYLDGNLDYNIRSYNSIVHVEVDGRRVRETEYKFYPPGKLAAAYGRGQAGPGEGVEVVTITVGEQLDASGAVRITSVSPAFDDPGRMIITVLTADTALRTVANAATGIDTYRMFITLPTRDKRYVENLGIISEPNDAHGALGGLRGFSLFRGTRIAEGDFEGRRAALRLRNAVHAVVTAGPDDKPLVRRLD
jgi:hypothetical protein